MLVLAGCLGGGDSGDTVSYDPAATKDGSATAPSSADPVEAPEGTGSVAVLVVTSEFEPVSGAQVLLADTERAAYTDTEGRAAFSGIEPDSYTVLAAKPGYRAIEDEGKLVEVVEGETVEVSLHLDPVEVVSEDNSYQKSVNMQGFIACSFDSNLIGYTSYCSRGLAVNGQEIWRDPRDNSTHPWEIDNIQVQSIVVETRWEPSAQALGTDMAVRTDATLSCDVYHCSTKGTIGGQARDDQDNGEARGSSPLYTIVHEGNENNITEVVGEDAELYPATVWTVARAWCDDCPMNLLINHQYESWASSFYGAPAPEGWSVYP